MKKSELKALIREVIEEMSFRPDIKIFDYENNPIEVEKSDEEQCHECGDDTADIYFIPSWGVHRCYGCLTHDAKKYGYKVERSV